MKRINLLKVLLISSIISSSLLAEIVWLKEAPKRMNWQDAIQYCKTRDAILPSKAIYKTMWIANGKSADLPGFENSVSYWTSTEVKNNKLAAYPFYFGEGRDDWYYKADHYGVRCIKK